MKLIVLSAGKGKRFLPTTEHIPKGMIPVLGEPLLKHVVGPYLKHVSDIIFVVSNPLGMQVRQYFKEEYFGHKVIYRIQEEQKGTMDALLACKDLINEEEIFCACNGDDLLKEPDIENALRDKTTGFGVSKKIMPKGYLGIQTKNGQVIGFQRHKTSTENVEDLFYNGFNILDHRVFEFKPVMTKDGELGLPQTLFENLAKYPLRAFAFEKWETVNRPEDIADAEKFIKND